MSHDDPRDHKPARPKDERRVEFTPAPTIILFRRPKLLPHPHVHSLTEDAMIERNMHTVYVVMLAVPHSEEFPSHDVTGKPSASFGSGIRFRTRTR